MITGQTCSTCAAYSALTSECRRKAPTAVMIQVAPGQANIKGIYPATAKDHWCCEWVPVSRRTEMLGVTE